LCRRSREEGIDDLSIKPEHAVRSAPEHHARMNPDESSRATRSRAQRTLVLLAGVSNAVVAYLLAFDVSFGELAVMFAVALAPLLLLAPPLAKWAFRRAAATLGCAYVALSVVLLLATPVVPILGGGLLLLASVLPCRGAEVR
jgi:hypothetical protein